jgi:hypothetical protein
MNFICTTAEINETQINPAEPSVRDYILGIWDIVEGSKNIMLWNSFRKAKGGVHSLQDFRAYIMYACEYPSRRKRTPMDVSIMVYEWTAIIRGLSTAHDKESLDRAEFDMDEHLTPLLTAPVKQIREFYTELVTALKNDPTIPFFVWAWFESWGKVILQNAPDSDVKQLKTALAAEIAELVEEDVKPDLRKAIEGALKWRSEESLEKIKTTVQKGGKARMVGKESCLFLEVEHESGTERVML